MRFGPAAAAVARRPAASHRLPTCAALRQADSVCSSNSGNARDPSSKCCRLARDLPRLAAPAFGRSLVLVSGTS
jgi:hypothetical protein